jgi:hypothetical protein
MPPIHKNTKGNTKNCFGVIWCIGDLVAILKVIHLDVRYRDRGDLVENAITPRNTTLLPYYMNPFRGLEPPKGIVTV